MKKFLKYFGILIVLLITTFFIVTSFSSYNYLRGAIWYNYVDIDDYKIFHNRAIKTGKHQPWTNAADYNKKTPSEANIKKFEQYKTVSFLVLENNTVKYERYWEGYNESSKSNSFSMAKTVISLLIGAAIDEGKIKSADQKVNEFFPQFKGKFGNKLTIRHLLTMSSGFNWDESYAEITSITTKAYYGKDLERIVKQMKVIEEPGKRNNYQGGNTQVLAFIVEKATGKTIADYASEKLWVPMGAKHEALWSLDRKDGHEKAYCCFNSNARDFARLGQLILLKGKWQGKQLISEKYIEEATRPAKELKAETGQGMNNYYGFQFWYLEYKGLKIPYYRGILGQYIFVIPRKNAVVVRLGHDRDPVYGDFEAPNDVRVYLDAALEILK